MPYLNKQIAIINDQLETGLQGSRFGGAKLDGIAYPCVRKEGDDSEQVIPAVLYENAVERFIDLDDTYPMGLYHKISGNGYSQENNGGQYGNGNSRLVKQTQMAMIVYGKTSRIKLRPEDLEAYMISLFPSEIAASLIAPLSLNKMTVDLLGSNMNAPVVFQNEFRGVDYFLGPEDILFQIDYRVTSKFDRKCFNLCDCDEQ